MKERKDVNQYEKVLISDRNMINNNSQMEQWSILSDNIVYVRSEGNDVMNGTDIKMVDYRDHKRMYRKMGKEEGEQLNIDLGESPEILRDKYMDVYEEIYAKVVMTSKFDENVNLSTTYLGRIDIKREDVKVKVKVLLLYSAAQLNQMVSVVLYNLTPGRGLTQPWCEPSP